MGWCVVRDFSVQENRRSASPRNGTKTARSFQPILSRVVSCCVIGSSGWTRTSNPPVNRQKAPVLPTVAATCAESPDRELDPMNTRPIEEGNDAAVSCPNPRLGVSKGQEKGKVL